MVDLVPGDEILFFGTKYTILEPMGKFGWIAIETGKADAKPRVVLSEYLSEPL